MDHKIREVLEDVESAPAWTAMTGSLGADDVKRVEGIVCGFAKEFSAPFDDAVKRVAADPSLLSLLVKKLTHGT